MKRFTLAAVLFALLCHGHASAQCHRRSGGRTPSATSFPRYSNFNLAPVRSATATMQPLAYPNVYQTQLAQQQYLLSQQRYVQAISYQNQLRQNQFAAQRNVPLDESATELENSSSNDSRQTRLREENARRAFRLAEQAEANEQYVAARRYYSRVVRILGEDADLAQRATTAASSIKEP